MNKLGLFLDDERNPSDVTWIDYAPGIDWIVARNYKDFVKLIDNSFIFGLEFFDYVSFDNDLAEEKEGRDCARMMCEIYANNKEPLPTCFIHSQNPEGAANIKSILDSYNKIFNYQSVGEIIALKYYPQDGGSVAIKRKNLADLINNELNNFNTLSAG